MVLAKLTLNGECQFCNVGNHNVTKPNSIPYKHNDLKRQQGVQLLIITSISYLL